MALPTLPSIPTDSFYKFMTLSGIALLITAVVVQEQQVDRLTSKTRESLVVGQLQSGHYQRAFAAKLRLDSLDTIPRLRTGTRPDSLRRVVATSTAAAEKLDTVVQSASIQQRDVQTTALRLLTLLNGVYGLGMVMTGLGFAMWWGRIQQPLDKVARCEGDKAEIEVGKLKQLAPLEVAKLRAEVAAAEAQLVRPAESNAPGHREPLSPFGLAVLLLGIAVVERRRS